MFGAKCHIASELKTLDAEVSRLPVLECAAKHRLARVRRVVRLPEKLCVLDVGSALGSFVVAFSRLGCECIGVEPYAKARGNGQALSGRLGTPLPFVGGAAEQIPFEDESFSLRIFNRTLSMNIGDL